MERVVGAVAVAFWASVALVAVLVALAWIAPDLRDAKLFLDVSGAAFTMAMVTSAFLFWRELRANRQELRAARRESRDIPVEEVGEWTPKAWLYGTAFALSFFLSWYLLPSLLLS